MTLLLNCIAVMFLLNFLSYCAKDNIVTCGKTIMMKIRFSQIIVVKNIFCRKGEQNERNI